MSSNAPLEWTYEDIAIGSCHSFEKSVSPEIGVEFSRWTGDSNALHMDLAGEQSPYGRPVVHGMLAASLFSTLIGMYCPGKWALYLSQEVNFHLPVFYGDRLLVRGTVIGKVDALRIITLKTEVLCNDRVAISGKARARVLEKGT